MHVIAAKAVAFQEALEPEFKDYQRQVLANARLLCACLAERGYPIVSGGTDNHMLLVDLTRTRDRRARAGGAGARRKRTSPSIASRAAAIRQRADARQRAACGSARRPSRRAASRSRRCGRVSNWIADLLDAGGDAAVIARVASASARDVRGIPGLRSAMAAVGSNACDTNHRALSVLQFRGHEGDRLAPRGRGPPSAPPPRMPVVRRALHDVRDRPSS